MSYLYKYIGIFKRNISTNIYYSCILLNIVEDLHLPPMRRTSKSLATSDNDEKAKILTERFFPQPAPADLSNITGETPATCLRVDSDITTEEMARTISCLLNNTALRPDKIPNKALKTYRPFIAP